LLSIVTFCIHEDYYEILGVSRHATFDEIKDAYKRLALKWHPDRHKNSANQQYAHKKFVKISEAYQALKKAHKRNQFDDKFDRDWFQFGDESFHFSANFDIEDIIGKENLQKVLRFLYWFIVISMILCCCSILGCCVCFFNVCSCLCKSMRKKKVN